MGASGVFVGVCPKEKVGSAGVEDFRAAKGLTGAVEVLPFIVPKMLGMDALSRFSGDVGGDVCILASSDAAGCVPFVWPSPPKPPKAGVELAAGEPKLKDGVGCGCEADEI